MLGWNIGVYRQLDGGATPAAKDSPHGQRVAVWQTGLYGCRWIDQLVEAGLAQDFGPCNGYPCRYTAMAKMLLPPILAGPPEENKAWIIEEGSVIADTTLWVGKTFIDRDIVAQCRPDEWLLVEAWDES